MKELKERPKDIIMRKYNGATPPVDEYVFPFPIPDIAQVLAISCFPMGMASSRHLEALDLPHSLANPLFPRNPRPGSCTALMKIFPEMMPLTQGYGSSWVG